MQDRILKIRVLAKKRNSSKEVTKKWLSGDFPEVTQRQRKEDQGGDHSHPNRIRLKGLKLGVRIP